MAEKSAHGAMDINEVFRGGGRSVEFLDEINKAGIVMLDDTRIVPRAIASAIAKGIAQVMAQERESGRTRSADYLDYEPRLTAVVGPDASRLHTGRSRQDIASTIARMNLRDGLLKTSDALVSARDTLLSVASRHTETIIPAYTHGVQAQPTTFAHYLLALAAALARQVERMQQAYVRINRNPLGSAALAGTPFPVNRRKTAKLMGFESPTENSLDAVSDRDYVVEFLSAASL
ncbi:MAG: lyase family protein, partial [Pseudomonadota bacterium]